MKKHLDDVLVLLAIIAGIVIFLSVPQPKRDGMRIVVLKGDTIESVEDLDGKQGRFYYLFSRQGIFYFDSTIGRVFEVNEHNWNLIGEGHKRMIRAQAKELVKRWK